VSLVQISSFVKTPERKIDKKVRFPRKILRNVSRFFVTVDAIDGRGIVIQTETLSVNHSKNLVSFSKPLIPPSIRGTVTRQPGLNVIKVTQNDKRASGFLLYKRTMGNSSFNNNLPYHMMGAFSITADMGSKVIRDKTNNSKTVIYRVIPFLEKESLTTSFSTFVVKGLKNVLHNRIKRLSNISIFSFNEESYVKITVSKIKDDPVALQLVRRNLTKHEKVFKNVKDGYRKVRNMDSGKEATFSDPYTKSHNIYEYGCYMIFESGERVFGNDNTVIEARRRRMDTASISITNLNVLTQEKNVIFDVESLISKKPADQLQTLLEKQGLGTIFSDIVNANRAELSGLIAHEIKRIDLTSGDEEFFGVFTEKTFNDAKVGKVTGVSPLKEGREYMYEITTLLRKPQQLVPNYQLVKDSPNGKYLVSPAKYFNPYTLRTGIGVEGGNPAAIAKSPLALGSLNNFERLPVIFPEITPEVIDVSASRFTRNFVRIDWKISGNSEKIDYFIIVAEQFGIPKIIDLTHANSNDSEFEYLHEIDPNNPSEITYQIIPKLISGDDGVSLKSRSVVIK
jgi:hypothetical protein